MEKLEMSGGGDENKAKMKTGLGWLKYVAQTLTSSVK